METNNKVHELIKALTKAEKRYFNLYSSRISPEKEKNYLLLFDLLDGMDVYNEKLLKEKLTKAGIQSKLLSADRNYLYKMLMEALTSYHSEQSVTQKVKSLLIQIEILYNKGLYKSAGQLIKKAYKLTSELGMLAYKVELADWEARVQGVIVQPTMSLEFYDQIDKDIIELENVNAYNRLYSTAGILRTNIFKARDKSLLKEFDDFMQSPLLQTIDTALSIRARIRYHQIKAQYYYSKDDSKNEYACNKNLVELLEERKLFIQEYPLEYIKIFSRFLILRKNIEPQLYLKSLQDFKNFPNKVQKENRKAAAIVFALTNSTELVRMFEIGAFKEAQLQLAQIQKGLKKYVDLIDPAVQINFYYKFAYAEIGAGSYTNALDYVNYILNNFDQKARPDIYSFSKLLELVVHFSLGNYSLVRYKANSTKSYLKKKNMLFKSEEAIINRLKGLSRFILEKRVREGLKELRTELNEILKDPHESRILNYFNFKAWLDHQIDQKPFDETGYFKDNVYLNS